MSDLSTSTHSVDAALEALRAGKMVIVLDAQERENEGDLICAAQSITPEQVNFMLRQGAGVLCAPLTTEVAARLQLTPIVEQDRNTSAHQTPFLIPVDHANSGTGVSALSRAMTLTSLAHPRSVADDFVRPGHINPLLARDGGVLRRAGHTEATVDLMRLAGLTPVGCLIEICSQRGDGMADIDELREFSAKHSIPMISIADIIQYRRTRERLIHREADVPIPTELYGTPRFIAYGVEHDDQEPLALVWGDLTSVEAPLVRMHSSCFTGDILGSLRCDCGDQLHMAMSMITEEGTGAVVYLPQEGRGIGLVSKLKAYQLQDQGLDTVEANHRLGFKADLRDYMVGLQILKDLGLSKVRILTNNPKKTEAFEQWVDLKVVGQVPIVAPSNPHRDRYMETKRQKMGHLLPPASGSPPCCGGGHAGPESGDPAK
ncbi:bifunctional 3,4-dihydroxy-2-butanone-4-phosphate synthase/GTP cyclohydrolase II [Planctomyces sp. SH-PL14]|uniref:bifunctional 3,4-dihydroxy-2-butanone-4-phosphate synthase/GTP cyclohydrolase II n=1 Tax=Planctomyces sp. SH-PL14 TaxID=1632864 RepID=UPI00078D653D|nr:bifunctional 3,4-dihydroxy-2-butanone-4-phosphate synthase/GTP cyclohydrolase II [Planctomyces sp. SH-PL14]AMV17079.1 Riboflavin biosynthesis protein RibBA [Planctomyces sp. SH-PL14]